MWSAVTAGRSGWCRRKLNCGQQALLVLVQLRKGETFAELGAGFGVGTRDRGDRGMCASWPPLG